MLHSAILLAATVSHTLADTRDQALSHADNLAEQLGDGVDVDIEAGTVTLPLSTLIELLQPDDVLLPAPPAGKTWEVLSVGAPAPVGATVALALDGQVTTIARPTGPAMLYLVPNLT